MNLKRTATLAIIGGALVAWFAGAATSNHRIVAPPEPRTPAIDLRGEDLAREIARLHAKLRPDAALVDSGRNLFSYRAAARRAPAPVAPLPPAPALSEARPIAPPLPAVKLEGISEDAGPDGPVRMAFINAEGQLFIVKEGESVTTRYRVTKITDDVVELSDQADHTTRRFALR